MMVSGSSILGAESLFAEARDGLLDFMGRHYGSMVEIMLRMALSPDLKQLEVIRSAFARSEEFPVFRAMVYDEEGRLKRGDYTAEHYLKEFSPAHPASEGDFGFDDVEKIASQLSLTRWSVPVRFELTGDDEIDDHIRLLVGFVRKLRRVEIGTLAMDPVIETGVAGGGNCFVYLVPEDANYLAEGSLLRISGRFHGKDPMSVIRTANEKSDRKRNGQDGTYSKFRTEYPRVVDWLRHEKQIQIGASDRVIPFTPFHQYGVDGLLVAGPSGSLKAAVSMVDCFAKGSRKLELVTEGLIRSLGLPGNHGLPSPMSTMQKDRRAKPARSVAIRGKDIDEATKHFGRTLFFSDIELKVLRTLYESDYASGMTGQEVLKIAADRKDDARSPRNRAAD